jgi:hypothetical protein
MSSSRSRCSSSSSSSSREGMMMMMVPDGESEPMASMEGPLPPHLMVSQSGLPHHLKKSHLNHLSKPSMKQMSSNAMESRSEFRRLVAGRFDC